MREHKRVHVVPTKTGSPFAATFAGEHPCSMETSVHDREHNQLKHKY